MKYVFLGLLYEEHFEEKLLKCSRTGLQSASNQYQWGIIKGLQQVLGKEIHIISSVPTGSYPKKNKRLFWNLKSEKVDYISFVNFYYFREYIRYKNIIKRFHKILKTKEPVFVFVYSLYWPFLKSLQYLKHKFKENLYFCLIVPDMPGRYGVLRGKYTVAGIWDRLIGNKLLEWQKEADSYILLTVQMKEPLSVGNKPYAVIEGFLPEKILELEEKKYKGGEDEQKIVLYTGSLNPRFGIKNLLEAFNQITDDSYKLWICGPPSDAGEVLRWCELDKRIVYKGYLTKAEIFVLQRQCTMVVNPRTDEGDYTKYSFPSKTMEYLLSTKPVVMYELPGIPEEYRKYLYFVKQPGVLALRDKILEIGSMDSKLLEIQGREVRKWILEQKNAKTQCLKIRSLINQVINGENL